MSFYVTGGTLEPGSPSYIERAADRDLFQSLMEGEFCYVLDARQIGKSSLMARTAARLRKEGRATAALDLSALGTSLDVQQWYYGLLTMLAAETCQSESAKRFWKEHADLGPLQRWSLAVREGILPNLSQNLVVFIDEIDVVRSLPFSTDEFFAGLREWYNRRSVGGEVGSLTFCLLGVATPAELIRSTRMTPFNIGKRINVADFTLEEAQPLAAGLAHSPVLAARLLARVFYWTDGHPYLTQRLCRAIADDGIDSEIGVDRLCEELFLSSDGREHDDNLLFARDRLLDAPEDPAHLLSLYLRVLRKRVRTKDVPPALLAEVLLTGVVKGEGGKLRVRNRLYQNVFNAQWVYDNLPDAERRRIRRAYLTGIVRSASALGAVVLVLTWLALYAVNQAVIAHSEKKQVEAIGDSYHHLFYDSQIAAAGEYLKENPPAYATVKHILQDSLQYASDLKGFEWGFLWERSLNAANAFGLRSQLGPKLEQVALDPLQATVYGMDGAQPAEAWSIGVGPPRLLANTNKAIAVALSGPWVARFLAKGVIEIENRATGAAVSRLVSGREPARLGLSSDGARLMLVDTARQLTLFDVANWNVRCRRDGVEQARLNADGSGIAVLRRDTLEFWDAKNGWRTVATRSLGSRWSSLAFDPTGRTIIAASAQTYAPVFFEYRTSDCRLAQTISPVNTPSTSTTAIALSPHGRRLFAGCQDGRVEIWDLATDRVLLDLARTPVGVHTPGDKAPKVVDLAVSENGDALAAAYADGKIFVWRARNDT